MNSVNSAIPLTHIYIYIYANNCLYLSCILQINYIYICVCVPYRYNIHNYPFRYWRYNALYMMEMINRFLWQGMKRMISGRHNNKAGRSWDRRRQIMASAGEALQLSPTKTRIKHSMIQQPKISKLPTPIFPQPVNVSVGKFGWSSSSFAQSHCWCRSWWRNNGRGSFLPWAGADPVAALHPRHLHPASWPMGSPLGKSHGENFQVESNALCFLPLKHLVSRFS